MTKYTVKSELTDTPWQIENRIKKNITLNKLLFGH